MVGTSNQMERFTGVAIRQAARADRRPSRKVTVNSLDRLTFSLNCSKTVASSPGGLQPEFMPNSSQIPRSLLLTGDFTNYWEQAIRQSSW